MRYINLLTYLLSFLPPLVSNLYIVLHLVLIHAVWSPRRKLGDQLRR